MYKEEGKIITFQIQTQKPETNKKKWGSQKWVDATIHASQNAIIIRRTHSALVFFFYLIFVLLLSREKLEVGYWNTKYLYPNDYKGFYVKSA